jgi:hypothetical protein
MFERYTEKARRVIFFARYEASQFGSPHIETEHLLLGLLREDKALANRLLPPDTSVEFIRKEIESRTTVGKRVSTSVDMPISNECTRVLAYAAQEAERMSHKHIGTEHLWLGLLREEKSFAAEILRERGVTIATAREKVAAGGDVSDQKAERSPLELAGMAKSYVEFIDITNGVRVGFCRWLLRPGVPRIGEEVILGSRSFRVRDVIHVFQDSSAPSAPGCHDLTEIVVKVEPTGEPPKKRTDV